VRQYIVFYPRPDSFSRISGVDRFLIVLFIILYMYRILLLMTFKPGVPVVLVGTVLLIRIVSRLYEVKEESLLIIQDFGVQLTTTYMTGRQQHKFIDKAKIKSILINEGITMCKVIYYLAIQVEGQHKLSLVFEHVFPRLPLLLHIYRGTRAIMYGEPDDHDMQATTLLTPSQPTSAVSAAASVASRSVTSAVETGNSYSSTFLRGSGTVRSEIHSVTKTNRSYAAAAAATVLTSSGDAQTLSSSSYVFNSEHHILI